MIKKAFFVSAFCLNIFLLSAQTSGNLSVSVTTSTTGGKYAPRNVLAIWVQDSTGRFVKTLLAYAGDRKTHLNIWEASSTTAGSAFNTVDAITGATQSSHGTRTCKWDGTDRNRKLVADGRYVLMMELTDKNSTGNYATFNFIKGKDSQNLVLANFPSFSYGSLKWTPSTSGTNPETLEPSDLVIYPNPGTGLFQVKGIDINQIVVTDFTGKVILISRQPVIDISDHPSGIYVVMIKTDQESFYRKIIKE
jgi:hypothetical protein